MEDGKWGFHFRFGLIRHFLCDYLIEHLDSYWLFFMLFVPSGIELKLVDGFGLNYLNGLRLIKLG